MKKLILAFVALAFAFAISSCCDQSYCPSNMKQCPQKQSPTGGSRRGGESFHDYDKEDQQLQPGQQQERSNRRW